MAKKEKKKPETMKFVKVSLMLNKNGFRWHETEWEGQYER